MVKMVGSEIKSEWKTFNNPLEVLKDSDRLVEYLEVCSRVRQFRILTTTDEMRKMGEEKTVTVKNRMLISLDISSVEDYKTSIAQLTDVLNMTFIKNYDKHYMRFVCEEFCNSVEIYFYIKGNYGEEIELMSKIAGCELKENKDTFSFTSLSCGVGF